MNIAPDNHASTNTFGAVLPFINSSVATEPNKNDALPVIFGLRVNGGIVYCNEITINKSLIVGALA